MLIEAGAYWREENADSAIEGSLFSDYPEASALSSYLVFAR